jgi:hypothetical protein
MRRRLLVVGLVVAAVVVAVLAYERHRGEQEQDAMSAWVAHEATLGSRRSPSLAPSGAASVDRLLDGGPLQKTLHDRQVRDEMRRRILAAWTSSPDEQVRSAAKEGRFVPIPEDRDASRAYLRSVVRDDFFPMAKQCYSELLQRNKHASGRIEISFKIVGDEKIGGVIDDATVLAEGGVDDPELITCMRESFLSLSFRPPPSEWLTVTYPIEFSPGEDEPDR